jgi:hypothetical protein
LHPLSFGLFDSSENQSTPHHRGPDMLHEKLDFVADCYNPVLIVILVTLIGITMVNKKRRLAARMLLSLILGLCVVYGLLLIDNTFQLWRKLGLDYSTHTAFSTCMIVLILNFASKAKAVSIASLMAYFLLMVYQKYHSVLDILTTAGGILPLLVISLKLAEKITIRKQMD